LRSKVKVLDSESEQKEDGDGYICLKGDTGLVE
jgi:hypothetical protein